MRIVIDKKKCMGAGLCAMAAPTLFRQDAKGFVELLNANPLTAEDQAAAREAADLCPSGTIVLIEDGAPVDPGNGVT